jgi:hypothetical protein
MRTTTGQSTGRRGKLKKLSRKESIEIQVMMYESLVCLVRVQERTLSCADGRKNWDGGPSESMVNDFFDNMVIALLGSSDPDGASRESLMGIVRSMDEASANIPMGSRMYGRLLADRLSQCATHIRNRAKDFPQTCNPT